jgi:hypothetical protein
MPRLSRPVEYHPRSEARIEVALGAVFTGLLVVFIVGVFIGIFIS